MSNLERFAVTTNNFYPGKIVVEKKQDYINS